MPRRATCRQEHCAPNSPTTEAIEPVPHGFELAVEATGRVGRLALVVRSLAVRSLAVRSLAPEGVCESAGHHFRPGEPPLLHMHLTGVTLRSPRSTHGRSSYAPTADRTRTPTGGRRPRRAGP
ncbi:hypothetical protein [Streptomyces europaeiscabiei]|uniref:hypothetical protein n=1 Tax=Streptomyces europaeiscabiei TaxID=146819 RepID=UPI0038F7277A